MSSEPRTAVFISHSSPDGNPFTIWLGAKLSSLGYEVWADVMRLEGGDDWQRKLEHALRHRTCKMLLVANQHSVEKQGVRNEIQIASDVARSIGDSAFIIPLRLAPFEAPFLVAHAQFIDFENSWAKGLAELLETLESTYRVPRTQSDDAIAIWRDIQLTHAREVTSVSEQLISNWLTIAKMPAKVRYFDFKAGISIGQSKMRMKDAPWAVVPFRRGFISFAPLHDLQGHFGPNLPLVLEGELDVDRFLEEGWRTLDVQGRDARNLFSDLARQALEQLFKRRGLRDFALSDRQSAWWAPLGVAPSNKVSFAWGDTRGQRQIQGVSLKRKMNWHFGLSVAVRTSPLRHVRMLSRLIFTEDGQEPFKDPKRMHRLRRSFAKTWRNARWRDMLLAFLYWLAEGREELSTPVAADETLQLALPPMAWVAPVSMVLDDEPSEPDDDDPSDLEDAEEEGSGGYGAGDEENDDE